MKQEPGKQEVHEVSFGQYDGQENRLKFNMDRLPHYIEPVDDQKGKKVSKTKPQKEKSRDAKDNDKRRKSKRKEKREEEKRHREPKPVQK